MLNLNIFRKTNNLELATKILNSIAKTSGYRCKFKYQPERNKIRVEGNVNDIAKTQASYIDLFNTGVDMPSP